LTTSPNVFLTIGKTPHEPPTTFSLVPPTVVTRAELHDSPPPGGLLVDAFLLGGKTTSTPVPHQRRRPSLELQPLHGLDRRLDLTVTSAFTTYTSSPLTTTSTLRNFDALVFRHFSITHYPL
jgi:hypothetical protein